MRKDVCYAAVFNESRPGLPPRCEHVVSSQVTKRQCCCVGSVGQGWGTPCQLCPAENSGRLKLHLCISNSSSRDLLIGSSIFAK